jgi:16S rRNA (guanine527-N7)-methyltransferase
VSDLTQANDFAAKFDVSRETMERMHVYESLVQKWNTTINLVSRSTLPEIWTRHFQDSADVFDLAQSPSGSWVDMGTGGGFPGAVVAILAFEKAPELRVTCIESDIRKCEFLRTVSRTTGVPLAVLSRRIEECPPQGANVVSARALSTLPNLLGYAARHLKEGGQALFQKGETWERDVDDAREVWDFDLTVHPSKTNSNSAILQLRDIKRA